MSDHALFSPSGRPAWALCPGKLREEAKYPESVSGAAAADGTHTHTLLEDCINKDRETADAHLGETMTDHDGTFVVTTDRIERVNFALAYIDSRLEEFGQVIAERKVDPEPLIGRKGAGGTVDVTIFGSTWIEIIDYKDGMNPVPSTSLQLNSYGWGTLAAGEISPQLETIRFTVIQPKLREKGMTGISSHEMTIAELIETKQAFIDQIDAASAPDAPLVPGETQCRYCRAKGSCSALVTQSLAASGITFANLDVAKEAAAKDPNEMSNDQIREVLEAAPLIRQMIEACEVEAMKRFEAGNDIDGLKLVRGRGSRSWAADEPIIAEKLKKMGIPKEVLWKTSLITPAQVEKAKWQKRNGDQVQLTDRQLKLLSADYIKKSEGKLTVVSAADERPAVTISAAKMFAPVPAALPDFLTLPSFLV